MSKVECTHCRVLMTSWSAAGSPVRYWQCPFCTRTFSSQYAEVFDRRAGARRVEAASPRPAEKGAAPQASEEEIAWTQLRLRASRWFERLEGEGRRVAEADPEPAPAPAPVETPTAAPALAAPALATVHRLRR